MLEPIRVSDRFFNVQATPNVREYFSIQKGRICTMEFIEVSPEGTHEHISTEQLEQEYPDSLKSLYSEAKKYIKFEKSINREIHRMKIFQKYFCVKEIKDLCKKANYYEFFLVKRPFTVEFGNYKKQYNTNDEIRDKQERIIVNGWFGTRRTLKKTDYIRTIKAPNRANRIVQFHAQKLLDLLIEEGLVNISQAAHGFVKGRNAKTACIQHLEFHEKLLQNKNIELPNNLSENEFEDIKHKQSSQKPQIHSYCMDIENFFPTISKRELKRFLKKLLCGSASCSLANILTIDGKLVQGSILSPMITNLYFYQLDSQILKHLENTDICYTRYADDITLSSNKPIPKTVKSFIIATLNYKNFKINPRKIHSYKNIIWCCGLYVKWNFVSFSDYQEFQNQYYNQSLTKCSDLGENYLFKKNIQKNKIIKIDNRIMSCGVEDPYRIIPKIHGHYMDIRIKRSVFRKARKTIITWNNIAKWKFQKENISDFDNMCEEDRNFILGRLKFAFLDEYEGFIDERHRSFFTGKTRYNLAKGYFSYRF